MLFDTTVSRKRLRKPLAILLDSYSLPPVCRVAAAYWCEHCVECGAPTCYATCEKFKPSHCGWCERFENGIELARLANGAKVWAVRFKPWGKLELDTDGKSLSCATARWVMLFDECVSPLISFLTRMCFGENPSRLSTFTSYYRHKRDVLVRRIAKPSLYDVWYITCWVEHHERLTAAVFYPGEGEVLVHPLELSPGWNHFEFDVRGLKPGAYFRIYSIEGTKGEIVFANLTVGVRANGQNADATNMPAKRAKYVKCVAWDLDNTLWRGVLANDGPDGLSLNDRAIGVIKALDARGIMNTIASKNDYDFAWAQLKLFGIDEYFVFPRIDWMPKSENLKLIAADMNIGIDTFAFVDDSFHERGEVGENLPMVRVYADTDIEHLLDQECFNPPLSAESGKRRLSYLAEMMRKRSASVFAGSHDDFLRSCEITLQCERVADDVVRKRCWELVNRTNQLTLAARRYREKEFDDLLASSNAFAVRCQDKYGDYGIVGFIAVQYDAGIAKVAEFVMSCRVAKKKCEQSVVFAVAEDACAKGVHVLEAVVVETGRNSALVEAFDLMPFKIEKHGQIRRYVMHLGALASSDVTFFRNPVQWL